MTDDILIAPIARDIMQRLRWAASEQHGYPSGPILILPDTHGPVDLATLKMATELLIEQIAKGEVKVIVATDILSMAERAKMRPANFADLTPEERWAIDKRLGILDWEP